MAEKTFSEIKAGQEAVLGVVRIRFNPRHETRDSKQRVSKTDSLLHRVLGSLVLRFAHSFFDGRIGDGENSDGDENDYARKHQPFCAVRGGGNPQVVLGDLPQGESEHERWPRPTPLNHEVAGDAENESYDNVVKIVVGRKGADEHEEHKKGYQQRTADKR